MAGMDLTGRRANRGISVFWMILVMGVGVFALVAILLVGADQAVEPVPSDEGAEIVATEGETQVLGSGNSEAAADDNDPTMLDEDVTVSGPQEEGDLSVEDVEADVEPAGEAAAEADAGADGAATEEPAAEAAVEADAAEAEGEATEAEGADAAATEPAEAEGADEEATEPEAPGDGEIVVDPDGTTAPVEPTPSGPEGRDDETIADEVTE